MHIIILIVMKYDPVLDDVYKILIANEMCIDNVYETQTSQSVRRSGRAPRFVVLRGPLLRVQTHRTQTFRAPMV